MAEGTVWRVPPKHAVFLVPVGTEFFEVRAREIPFCPPRVRTALISVRGGFCKDDLAGRKFRSEIAEVFAEDSLPFSPPAVGASALERERAEKGAEGAFLQGRLYIWTRVNRTFEN